MAVVKRKKNKKREPESAAEALEKIEGRGDQLAEWIGENPTTILGVAATLLIVTAAYGFATSSAEGSRSHAFSELAIAKSDYRRAMGATPGAMDIPEPANPEVAKKTRGEFIERYQSLATENDGNLAGSLSLLESGVLKAELDNVEGAVGDWNAALEDIDSGSPLRGILLERIAIGHEQLGDFAAAAASHEEAAAITSYPLRYVALGNAARCHAEAGDADAALAAYERVGLESPDLQLPEHTEFMLLELKASRAL